MADSPETQDVEIPEEEGPKRKSALPLVAALLVSLGGGGAIGVKALGPKLGSALAARAEAKAQRTAREGEGSSLPLHMVDNLVVNPAESGGARFLLTSVAIETRAAADTAVLTARDVEIRDAFIMVLGSKTVGQLSDINMRTALSDELLKAVQNVVGSDVVRRVFLPQFVIQ